MDRVSATEVTFRLSFYGNIDTDATLTIEMGAAAILNYNEGFTMQLPVTAVEESLVATTVAPLTEATLSGGAVTLTLSGRSFTSRESSIRDALTVTGIEGVSVIRSGVDRVSATEVTFRLSFYGNIDTDATLTIEMGAAAILNYNEGFTMQLPVTAVEESLVATTVAPLTEATLSGGAVTLTLSGRSFTSRESSIRDALTVTGIEGVSVIRSGVDRVSATEVTVKLSFYGNIDTDATLTITVNAAAIAGYNKGFTFEFPITAVEESLVASTESPLIEATLDGSVVTFKLTGRSFRSRESDIRRAVTISGIEGVTISTSGVERVSDTEVTFELSFSGDFDENGTLTFTVGADAIAGYSEALTAQISVTAVKQSNAKISLSPNPVVSTPLGEQQWTVNLNIAGGENIAGYQTIVLSDASVLRYVESAKGNYLPDDAFFVSSDQPLGEVITINTTPEAEETTAGVCKVGDVLAPAKVALILVPMLSSLFLVMDLGISYSLQLTMA